MIPDPYPFAKSRKVCTACGTTTNVAPRFGCFPEPDGTPRYRERRLCLDCRGRLAIPPGPLTLTITRIG